MTVKRILLMSAVATNPIGESLMATPAISEGMIFVRSASHVYGLSEKCAKNQKAAK